jgi:hypothetical protein
MGGVISSWICGEEFEDMQKTQKQIDSRLAHLGERVAQIATTLDNDRKRCEGSARNTRGDLSESLDTFDARFNKRMDAVEESLRELDTRVTVNLSRSQVNFHSVACLEETLDKKISDVNRQINGYTPSTFRAPLGTPGDAGGLQRRKSSLRRILS